MFLHTFVMGLNSLPKGIFKVSIALKLYILLPINSTFNNLSYNNLSYKKDYATKIFRYENII